MFPYINKIIVKDCYASRDFQIDFSENTGLKHLILTGKNGSGKTTILNRIAGLLRKNLTKTVEAADLADLELNFTVNAKPFFQQRDDSIFTYYTTDRKVDLADVQSVINEQDLMERIKSNANLETFTAQFKQYLVNKKVYQAFDYMEGNQTKATQKDDFFLGLTRILRTIFSDEKLELRFQREHFEFYLVLSDKREITFNQLSDGFSAFINIIADLIMHTDVIRRFKHDYTYQPNGIILIDEPECHCHLAMQYQVLPVINALFPNLQIITATHSPAVISSLKEAVVYDLTSKELVADWIVCASFSELMVKHFGLKNEFSETAEKIILEVTEVLRNKNREEAQQKLQTIIEENQALLTPSLRLEIESRMILLKNQE